MGVCHAERSEVFRRLLGLRPLAPLKVKTVQPHRRPARRRCPA